MVSPRPIRSEAAPPRPARTGPSRQALSRRKAEAIEARRRALIEELASLRQHNGEAKFAESALQLLTRWWAKANWTAREKLLTDAVWLIRVENQQRQGSPRTPW